LDIYTFALGHDIDPIATSTHRLDLLQHVLIGSVAEQVVRHVRRSVLVVPSHVEIRMAKLTNERGRATQKTTRRDGQLTERSRTKAVRKIEGRSPRIPRAT